MLRRCPAKIKPTNPGNRTKIVYGSRLKPDGTIELYEREKIDVLLEINSHASECDMSIILSRIMRGDTSMLRQNPMYGDFSTMPRTYADMFNMVTEAEYTFDHLPVEVKNRFGNDKLKWFATLGTPDWYNNMYPEPKESEVKE